MTREEQLKQAIQRKFPKYDDLLVIQNNINAQRVIGAMLSLKDPSILRHADPEIMKQAGWVREENYRKAIDGLKKCVTENDLPRFNAQLTLIDLNEMPQPPKQQP